MKHGLEIATEVSFINDQVNFYLADYRHGKRALATQVTFEEIADGFCAAPAFSLRTDEAQKMFEQLWSQGFRSKHDRGGADKLDAARSEHIADLRKAAKLA